MSKSQYIRKIKQKEHKESKETRELAKEILLREREAKKISRERKKRSKLKAINSSSIGKIKYKIIDEFINGAQISEIAEKYNEDPKEVREFIDNFHEILSNTRAINALNMGYYETENPVLVKLEKLEVLNEEFFNRLSDPESTTLTEDEALFAWYYTHKGNLEEAVELAELDVGLFKDKKTSYQRGLYSRGIYLYRKPNVLKYIKELKKSIYQPEDVNKSFIQQMLLEEIERTKNSGDTRNTGHLRQLIELLGKTIGAFTERIEITEVDPNKALDHLIEMAKVASVREVQLPCTSELPAPKSAEVKEIGE